MPGASNSVSRWLPSDSPKTTAAAISHRSPDLPADSQRCQPTNSRSNTATSARCNACGSAWRACAQTAGATASAMPAASPTSQCLATTAVVPASKPQAAATSAADSRFARKAGSPNGWKRTDASQSSRVYVG